MMGSQNRDGDVWGKVLSHTHKNHDGRTTDDHDHYDGRTVNRTTIGLLMDD